MSQNDINKRVTKNESPNENYPPLKSKEKVLVVVKTIPNPSTKYRETVCVAGITEKGKLIRLYPLAFRYSEFGKRFSKYQWVEFDIEKRPKNKDFRIDSYSPNIKTIIPIGKPLKADKWTERKKIVLPLILDSLEQLEDLYSINKISLGIFKPKEILDFKIEKAEENWSKKQQAVLSQQVLFEKAPKELQKMPYKFSYIFLCDDERCKSPHKLQIIDWELYELYRNMKFKYPYEPDLALEKVKQKWFHDMWRDDRDSYLIVGTTYPKPSFNVLGVFWPPK